MCQESLGSPELRVRRCQILLASARGQRPAMIAQHLGCATQNVRHALYAFDTLGWPRCTRGRAASNVPA